MCRYGLHRHSWTADDHKYWTGKNMVRRDLFCYSTCTREFPLNQWRYLVKSSATAVGGLTDERTGTSRIKSKSLAVTPTSLCDFRRSSSLPVTFLSNMQWPVFLRNKGLSRKAASRFSKWPVPGLRPALQTAQVSSGWFQASVNAVTVSMEDSISKAWFLLMLLQKY
jgi:hypothetical protein